VRNAISKFIEMDLEEIQLPKTIEASYEIVDDQTDDEFNDAPLSQLAVTEKEKWILEEYERMIENTNIQAELEEVVTCPMCSRGALKLDDARQVVVCSLCSLLLPNTMPLADLEQGIIKAVDNHSRYCGEQPEFMICPEETTSSLIQLCSECGLCYQIV